MKSLVVHYKNKYPDCMVNSSENSLDVYSVHGAHLVAVRKNGAGQVYDASAELGCVEKHDLSPICKESRVNKLFSCGKIDLDEKQGKDRKVLVKADLEKEVSDHFEYSEELDYHKAKTL